VLLLALACVFLAGAWRALRAPRAPGPARGRFDGRRAGYALGLGMALSSPWNVGFWLAVMGRPEVAQRGIAPSLILAASVMLGALAWCAVLASAVTVLRVGAASRWWEVGAKAATGLLMLVFAAKGVLLLAGH
jgi:threonine/homoserine/homoserine lactone efflux protein